MDIEDYLIDSAKEAAAELGVSVVDKHVPDVSLELLSNVIAWVVGSNTNAGELRSERCSVGDQSEIKALKEEIKRLENLVYAYRDSVAIRRNVDSSQVYVKNGTVYYS